MGDGLCREFLNPDPALGLRLPANLEARLPAALVPGSAAIRAVVFVHDPLPSTQAVLLSPWDQLLQLTPLGILAVGSDLGDRRDRVTRRPCLPENNQPRFPPPDPVHAQNSSL